MRPQRSFSAVSAFLGFPNTRLATSSHQGLRGPENCFGSNSASSNFRFAECRPLLNGFASRRGPILVHFRLLRTHLFNALPKKPAPRSMHHPPTKPQFSPFHCRSDANTPAPSIG